MSLPATKDVRLPKTFEKPATDGAIMTQRDAFEKQLDVLEKTDDVHGDSILVLALIVSCVALIIIKDLIKWSLKDENDSGKVIKPKRIQT